MPFSGVCVSSSACGRAWEAGGAAPSHGIGQAHQLDTARVAAAGGQSRWSQDGGQLLSLTGPRDAGQAQSGASRARLSAGPGDLPLQPRAPAWGTCGAQGLQKDESVLSWKFHLRAWHSLSPAATGQGSVGGRGMFPAGWKGLVLELPRASHASETSCHPRAGAVPQ